MDVDYSLYLVTDRSFLSDRSLKYCIEEAIKGGVTIVQIREKDASTKEFYNIAKEIKEITDKYKVPLIINDRIDIAMAVDAEGVHLGQSDMPLNIARKILGYNKIIGISANNLKEAKEAQEAGADYIGVGPVFYTSTKKDINVPTGIEGITEIAKNIKIPMVAIGGINENNVIEVMKSGVNGISLISAILNKKDIQKASKLLKDKIEKGR